MKTIIIVTYVSGTECDSSIPEGEIASCVSKFFHILTEARL